MERCETAPGPHPVGHHGGQHRPPPPGRDLHRVALRDPQLPCVKRMQLHEGTRVQLVELEDLARFRERVPLVLEAPGVQYERVVVVGQFGGGQVRPGVKDGSPAGSREAQFAPVDVPDGVAVGPVFLRRRPLHRRGPQPLVRHPAQVPAGHRVPELPQLLEDLLRAVVGEALFVAHRAGDGRDDLPVGECLAGWGDGGAGEGEGAFAVCEDALGLGPHRAGEDDIGVGVGLGVGEDVLGDDELGRLQPLDDGTAVGDRGDGVGADDPAGLDVAVGHLPEQLDRAPADAVRADRAGRQAPELLGELPFRVDEYGPLARQPRPHVAHFAAAHRVRLAGEGERAAAGAADRAGREMQVDQGVGVPGAVRGLVEAHRPAAHPLARLADQPGRRTDVGLGETGEGGDGVRRVVGEEVGQRLPAVGVRGDELRVGVAAVVQQPQQAVEQGEIGTRRDLQEEVRLRRRGRPARVDDDQLGARLDPFHHPQEEDRMAVGHVGADDQEHVRALEVVVRPRRSVRAQRRLVTGARTRHAQPGVGLDLVRPDEALGQLVRQVLSLQGHLPRDVEGDRVRPVLVDDPPEPSRGLGDRVGHGCRHRLRAPLVPDQRPGQPARCGEHVGRGRALGAEPPGVRRVRRVAGRPEHRRTAVRARADVEQHAAAHTAVRADRPYLPRRRRRHGVDRTNGPLRRCHAARS